VTTTPSPSGSAFSDNFSGWLSRTLTDADPTGQGITLAVIDDGFQIDHPDFRDQYDATLDYDWVSQDSDPSPKKSDNHGTPVMGVAHDWASEATLVGLRIGYGGNGDPWQYADAIEDAARFDVANGSWGYSTHFTDDFTSPVFYEMAAAYETGVETGRGGLGTIYVSAAGNSARSGDDVNHHNIQNAIETIAVGAVDSAGEIARFSTPGAAVLVVAPGVNVSASDRTGKAGFVSGDAVTASGTSFSAPAVSGIVARMLEANPTLGWRDVQEILALSGRYFASSKPETDWQETGAEGVNGGGFHSSRAFGFGEVDAHAAIRLAETWTDQSTSANMTTLTVAADPALAASGAAIPDRGSVSRGLQVTGDMIVEQIEVSLRIDHDDREQLRVVLVSPDGTESALIDTPNKGPGMSGRSSTDADIDFTVTSNEFWGETAAGEWTLRVEDLEGGVVGTLESWDLTLHGDAAPEGRLFVYTDDFALHGAQADRRVIEAGTGFAGNGAVTINAAAVTSASTIDLQTGATIAGRDVSYASGAVMADAVGGDGDDALAGTDAANTLVGGRGDDTITGRGGDDTISAGAGADTIAGGAGSDAIDGGAGWDVAVFDALWGGVSWVFDQGWLLISDLVTGAVDGLRDVESLEFADADVLVSDLAGAPSPGTPPPPGPTPGPLAGTDPASIAGLVLWLDSATAAAGGEAVLSDASAYGNDAVSVSGVAGLAAEGGWAFDGGDAYAIGSAPELDAAAGSRTFALSFEAGAGAGPQVIYEQGSGKKGLSIYQEGGEVHFVSWHTGKWGTQSVSLDVAAGETASLVLRFDEDAGTLTGVKNGVEFETVSGVESLGAHDGQIGLGETNGRARDIDGGRVSGGFEGTLYEFAAYDRALGDAEMAELGTHLAGEWDAGAAGAGAETALILSDAMIFAPSEEEAGPDDILYPELAPYLLPAEEFL
jgi:subtilisin-like proprotein convertase family protein